MIRHIKNKSKNIFQTKYAWFAGFLILVFLIFKTFDSTVNFFITPSKEVSTDSTEVLTLPEYDSLFTNLDQKIEKVILERNLTATSKEVHEMVKSVKIADPITSIPTSLSTYGNKNYSPTWIYETVDLSKSESRPKKIYTFFLVTHNGYIANRFGAVQYYLPGDDRRYYYEITLKEGIYTFITLGMNPNDTVPFAIDTSGVYKLGFQESHPNFIIFKNPLP